MAHYRQIDTRIWNDAKFSSLSKDAKLAFLFALTHPHMTMLGAMRANFSGLAAEIGVPVEAFQEVFQKGFQEEYSDGLHEDPREGPQDGLQGGSGRMLEYDPDVSFLWFPNFLRYNKPQSPNVVKSWVHAFDLLPECALKSRLFKHARAAAEGRGKAFAKAFHEAFEKPSRKTSGKTMPNQEQEQEQDIRGYDSLRSSPPLGAAVAAKSGSAGTARSAASPSAAGAARPTSQPPGAGGAGAQATRRGSTGSEGKEKNGAKATRSASKSELAGRGHDMSNGAKKVAKENIAPGVTKEVRSANGKFSEDARFEVFRVEIFKFWSGVNAEVPAAGQCPWGIKDQAALLALLQVSPDLDVVKFRALLTARARSEVTPSDPPRNWLADLKKFAAGPLDRYKQPLRAQRVL